MSSKEFAFLFLLLAFLVALHQYVNYGVWFEIKDIHHESIMLLFVGLAVGFWVR
jgi:hypothetical protein